MRAVTSIDRFLTSEEKIALELIFMLFGESPYNCIEDTWGTSGKYIDVAKRAPKLDVLHADINKILENIASAGYATFEICSFKKGDQYFWYKKFPTSLSKETVRKAWSKSRMRDLQLQYKRLKAESQRNYC